MLKCANCKKEINLKIKFFRVDLTGYNFIEEAWISNHLVTCSITCLVQFVIKLEKLVKNKRNRGSKYG